MLNTTEKTLVRSMLPPLSRVHVQGKKIRVATDEFLIDSSLGTDGLLIREGTTFSIVLDGSNEALDFLVNCASSCNDRGIHKGYYAAFEAVSQIILKQVYPDITSYGYCLAAYLKSKKQDHKILTLNFIGFSNGSAVNHLLACQLANCGFTNVNLVTIGEPNLYASRAIANRNTMNLKTYINFSHPGDIVAYFPFRLKKADTRTLIRTGGKNLWAHSFSQYMSQIEKIVA